jgi:hypothetical protein
MLIEFIMNKNRVILFYLLILVNHVAHVFEEVWGRFWLLKKVGLGKFLAINWLLFCIPVLLFYFILRDKRWAYKLSILYAGFMALQGMGHNVATIITDRYFNGFAGGFTGIGLMIIGTLLVYYLYKGLKNKIIVD